jgi:transcriptional regulator with XRE-family HTH domain
MSKNVDVIFTERFTRALDDSGYTRKAFGEALGLTETSIQRWIRGESHPTMNKIQQVADLLNKSPQWLFGAEEISPREKIETKIIEKLKTIQKINNLETVLMSIEAVKRGEDNSMTEEKEEA